MKIKLLLTALIIMATNVSLANGLLLQECEAQGNEYGNGTGKDYINPSCEKTFKRNANKKSKKTFLKETLDVFGYKNILYINNGSNKQTIAGNETMLNNIVAIDVHIKDEEIFVLDNEINQILIFSAKSSGNITPLRIINIPEIRDSSDISIDQIKGTLTITNRVLQKLIVIDKNSTSVGRSDLPPIKVLARTPLQ